MFLRLHITGGLTPLRPVGHKNVEKQLLEIAHSEIYL
jgi:hypothetical protein